MRSIKNFVALLQYNLKRENYVIRIEGQQGGCRE